MKNCILFLVCIMLMPTILQAQQLSGEWEGYIDVMGNQLTIITHFADNDTAYSGTLDIPQQGAEGLELQKIAITKKDSVFFEFFAGTGFAKFEGVLKDSMMKGSFLQAGQSFPFQLKKSIPKFLPYNTEDLLIQNGDITIAGTLTTPESDKINACVILLSGSGAQTRDSNVLGFKVFEQLADYLTENGIATFRFDDRGTGKSTGDFAQTTLGDMSSDVDAIISNLSTRDGLSSAKIIVLGHSQGGVVGGKVAANNNNVDGLILMASTGVPLKEILRFQVQQAYEGKDIPEEKVKEEIKARENLMEALKNSIGVEKSKQDYIQIYKSLLTYLPETERNQLGDLDIFTSTQTNQLEQVFGSPQMQSLLFHDPASDLQKINVPALVLFGGKDTQVTIEQNKEAIEQALDQADLQYAVAEFNNANHLFQQAESGAASEYGALEPKFVGGFLTTIKEWIKQTF